MPKKPGKNEIFKLVAKDKNTSDVQTFSFAPVAGKTFSFSPGDYITLYFLDDRLGWQGKSYSIISLPGERNISIAVKKLGKFSETIHNLKMGDTVKLAGPEGAFHLDERMKDAVFLAGGIGITPIYNILHRMSRLKKCSQKSLSLFYSNKNKEGIAFFQEFEKMKEQIPQLQVVHTLTGVGKEYKDPAIGEYERIDEHMLKKYKKLEKENYYFICGPISFTNDLWKMLQSNKIPESHIITEAFY